MSGTRTAYEYRLVIGERKEVEDGVEELTQRGWMMEGHHHATSHNGKLVFSQAMVKPYEQPGAWG